MVEFDLRLRDRTPPACAVRVGRGALDRLVEELASSPPGHDVVVISDSNVTALYGRPLLARLRGAGLNAHLASFPAGELHKTRETKAILEDSLLDLGIGRDAAVIALGGGSRETWPGSRRQPGTAASR